MKKEENQTMAKVTWINGKIDPPQSGEYYVTLEAKDDKNNVDA